MAKRPSKTTRKGSNTDCFDLRKVNREKENSIQILDYNYLDFNQKKSASSIFKNTQNALRSKSVVFKEDSDKMRLQDLKCLIPV